MGSTRVTGRERPAAAAIAGGGLLGMAAAAGFAYLFALGSLVEPGDAAATAANIIASESLFRGAIGAFLFVLVLDVVVAVSLYVLFRPVHRGVALLAAAFRLTYTAVHGAALLCLLPVVPLLRGAVNPGLASDQAEALAALLVMGHDLGFAFSLAFFGVHLVLLGLLLRRAVGFPAALGVLVLAAGAAYLVDSVAGVLLPSYGELAATWRGVLGTLEATGELALAGWLVYWAIKFRDSLGGTPARTSTGG